MEAKVIPGSCKADGILWKAKVSGEIRASRFEWTREDPVRPRVGTRVLWPKGWVDTAQDHGCERSDAPGLFDGPLDPGVPVRHWRCHEDGVKWQGCPYSSSECLFRNAISSKSPLKAGEGLRLGGPVPSRISPVQRQGRGRGRGQSCRPLGRHWRICTTVRYRRDLFEKQYPSVIAIGPRR